MFSFGSHWSISRFEESDLNLIKEINEKYERKHHAEVQNLTLHFAYTIKPRSASHAMRTSWFRTAGLVSILVLKNSQGSRSRSLCYLDIRVRNSLLKVPPDFLNKLITVINTRSCKVFQSIFSILKDAAL